LLGTEQIATVVRRELRKLKPGIKVDTPQIEELIKAQVIKREIYESEAGKEAQKTVAKHYRLEQRAKKKKANQSTQTETVAPETKV